MTDKQFDMMISTLESRILEGMEGCQTVEEAKTKVRDAFREAKEHADR